MKIFYEQADISDYVQVRSCVARDTSGERCDSLELELENAERWYRWGPQEDDRIRITHDGYDTGILYLHAILPENGKYRIHATALPCRARKQEYRSYVGKTLEDVMRRCALESGMDFRIFGLDGKNAIPYIQQEDESCAAFLSRLLPMEGAELKCINGQLTAIGICYAQERRAHQTVEITADQEGAEYRRTGEKYRALSIRTPWARATAEDYDVAENKSRILTNAYPANDDIQAGRWARGLLLQHNRRCETLRLASEFNRGYTAMTRIDVTGGTDADGKWLIAEAEHDFINLTSTARMHRCISTIR